MNPASGPAGAQSNNQPGRAARTSRALAGPAIALSLPLLHLFFVWALTLYDLQYFFARVVAAPLVYLVYAGYPPLLIMMAVQGPMVLASAKRWTWYPPLFVFLVISFAAVWVAQNKMLSRGAFQYILIYYAIALGTAVCVKTPRQALVIIGFLAGQFGWYAIWARVSGLVPWHPTLANYDGFGALMVQGVGICYWFAVGAVGHKKLRLVLYALAAYCVLGVVASFARAAFLSMVAVAGWIWIRSPRKVMAALYMVGAAVLVVVGASLIFEPGFFYNEIMSAFEEGTDEGTGGHRWDLWRIGFKVWMVHPIIGVGGSNFGVFASGYFRENELEGFPNPRVLYGYNLHNSYMQILAEFGALGILTFFWILWDFMKRNKELRSPEANQRWIERGGGKWSLRHLALGLEAANIANLLGGIFYASLFMPWFFTTWIANRMLWAVTRPADPATSTRAPRASRGRGG